MKIYTLDPKYPRRVKVYDTRDETIFFVNFETQDEAEAYTRQHEQDPAELDDDGDYV